MMGYASARDDKINDKVKCVAARLWAMAENTATRVEQTMAIEINRKKIGLFEICLRGAPTDEIDYDGIAKYAKSIGVQTHLVQVLQKELRLYIEVEGSDIIDLIGDAALLEQLAEECSELAQAALKMARKRRGTNPTPMTMEECKQRLTEEAADVLLCIKELHSIIDCDRANEIMDIKRDRWEKRIREKENKK